MVKEQQTPLSPEGTTVILSGSACFPGLTSGACACHRVAILTIAQLQNAPVRAAIPRTAKTGGRGVAGHGGTRDAEHRGTLVEQTCVGSGYDGNHTPAEPVPHKPKATQAQSAYTSTRKYIPSGRSIAGGIHVATSI